MTTFTTDRVKALANFRECDTTDLLVSEFDSCSFNNSNAEYLVLTQDEAYERATEYIKDSLWAFRPSFLTPFMKELTSLSDREFEQFEDILKDMQEKMCEGCNPIMQMMIGDNLDKLIEEAISCDGVVHFLNTYDGKEHEEGEYLIYRTN